MITKLYFYLFLLISTVSCQQLQQLLQLQIDDFLNSKLTLFPNQTIQHYQNLEEQTLENFKFLLEDDNVLNKAYESFKWRKEQVYNNLGPKKSFQTYNYVLLEFSQSSTTKYGERHNSLDLHIQGQRKDLFKENLVFIFHHNLLARMKLYSTFEMAVNKFADMFLDEFKRERLGLIIPDDYHANDLPHVNISEIELRSTPSHFDWRDHQVISPVKDQLKCGACVMFSMTSSIEGHHAINRDKEIVDLSEQFMVDCAVRSNGYSKNRGCDGNTFPDTLKFAKDYGITAEHLYPYEGKQGQCKFDGMYPTTHLKDFKRLPEKTNDVKHSVATEGPVSIGIYVWKPFMFYTSGVYDYCSYPSSAVGGHAMSITGFKEEGKYYIIKNQWGREWGENGYIRYSYTDSRCGLEKLAYSFTI